MEGRVSFFVILILQLVSWVPATSRSFATNDGVQVFAAVHQPVTGQTLQSPQGSLHSKFSSKQASGKSLGGASEAESMRGGSKIGSSPPSCEHKCFGCTPCEAIQVPTISRHSHVALQYANYEPVGWKCKCGPSFYSP